MTRMPTEWIADYDDEGAVSFRVGRSGEYVVAEWLGLATLIARRDGTDVRLSFEEGADPRNVEKLRRGSAWLLQRHLEDKLAMHGAAVSLDGKAIILLGRSGAGKSTLAAALCAAGASLLADDAVGLDPGIDPGSWLVVPREIDHWLDPAAATVVRGAGPNAVAASPSKSKSPHRTSRPADKPATLAGFVALGFGKRGPLLEPLQGIEAVGALVPQVARFIIDEPERQRRELDLLHSMVQHIPIVALERPRSFEHLSEAADLALAFLKRGC